MFFNREASIQIGQQRYNMSDGFYMDFEVPFYDSEELAIATFKVNNLSEETRKSIEKGQIFILNAGYEDDVGTIFYGTISAAKCSKNGTEWITEITAATALNEWLGSEVNKTYEAGTDAESIIRDLLTLFGLEIGRFVLTHNRIYQRGKVCTGKLKDVLKNIVIKECDSKMVIQNNQISINDTMGQIYSGVLLNPETGLLMDNDDNNETIIATDEIESKEKKEEKGKTIKKKCLLNHKIRPGELIQIQSKKTNGVFKVESGKHRGTSDGEWITELELRAI
jgi:hypothetical protein